MATQVKTTAVKPLELIASKADMEKAIASIQNRGLKLTQDIHLCAVSVLAHLAAHGDTTLVNRLLLAMPKSTRSKALRDWFLRFGKLTLNTDKESAKTMPLIYNKEGANDVKGAEAMPFWELTALESDKPLWSADVFLSSVVKRLESGLKDCTDPDSKAKILAALSALKSPVIESEPALV